MVGTTTAPSRSNMVSVDTPPATHHQGTSPAQSPAPVATPVDAPHASISAPPRRGPWPGDTSGLLPAGRRRGCCQTDARNPTGASAEAPATSPNRADRALRTVQGRSEVPVTSTSAKAATKRSCSGPTVDVASRTEQSGVNTERSYCPTYRTLTPVSRSAPRPSSPLKLCACGRKRRSLRRSSPADPPG